MAGYGGPHEATGPPSLLPHGFSPTTDLVFRALDLLGPRTAAALAREIGVTSRVMSNSLAELRAAGLVTESGPASTRTWSAVDVPRAIAVLRSRARPFPAAPVAPAQVPSWVADLDTGLAHLRSREAARERLSGLADSARHEQLALNPEMRFDESAMRAAAVTDRKSLDRGVTMRVVGVQAPEPDLLVPYGARLDSPMDYREAGRVPMKLVVLDRRVALFPVDPNNYERGYLEISQPPVVEALVALFEREWHEARRPPSGPDRPVFEEREAAVVALLAQGFTDATMARRLGISERSVSNAVRRLVDRFGVRNRFQLGLVLGSLGVVPASQIYARHINPDATGPRPTGALHENQPSNLAAHPQRGRGRIDRSGIDH